MNTQQNFTGKTKINFFSLELCQSKEAKEITGRPWTCFSAEYFFFGNPGQSKSTKKKPVGQRTV